MNYPTDTVVSIEADRVVFVNGRNRLEIYADKTIYQEDAETCGKFNEETGQLEYWDTHVPCPAVETVALRIETCLCSGWKSTPGCWCLGDGSDWLTVHLQADHLGAYSDDHQELPFFFEMIDPTIMSAAKIKIGELLGLEPLAHELLPDQLQARLEEYKAKAALGYISFSFGSNSGIYLKKVE